MSKATTRTSRGKAAGERARGNGNGSGTVTPRRGRALPVIQDQGAAPPRLSQSSETELRYWLASLVRLSDNIVFRAVRAYNRVFELEREDQADIYLAMARDFEREGKVEEVLEALNKAGIARPEDGRIRMQIGLLRLKAKAPRAAMQAFQQAKDLGYSTYRLHMSMAEALVQENDHERALREYEHALALSPDSAEVMHKLGTVLDRLGRYQEATEHFRRAVELAPDEVLYHQSLGFALESAGRRSDAVKCFKQALELEQRLQAGAE
jgi:tetratricopeptide (TPR) repeat protein